MRVKSVLKIFAFFISTYSTIHPLQNSKEPIDCLLSGGIMPVDLTPDLKVSYSKEAYEKKISGIVVLELIISENGNVLNTTTVSKKLGYDLDFICMFVYAQKKFSPCIIEGKAVTSKVLIPIRFKFSEQE
jgi:protein TonB